MAYVSRFLRLLQYVDAATTELPRSITGTAIVRIPGVSYWSAIGLTSRNMWRSFPAGPSEEALIVEANLLVLQ